MKRKFLIPLILVILSVVLVRGDDRTDKIDRLKGLKSCIEAVIKDQVSSLSSKESRKDIIETLNNTKLAFEKCVLDYPKYKQEILTVFDSYKKETGEFKPQAKYPDEAQEYSENLENKFRQLIKTIDDDMKELEQPPVQTATKKIKSQVKTGQTPAQPQAGIGFYLVILGLVIVISSGLIHFFFFKQMKSLIEARNSLIEGKLSDLGNKFNNRISDLDEKLLSELNEINNKINGMILQIKYLDLGQETEGIDQLPPGTEKPTRGITVEQEYIEELRPEQVMRPAIDFPQQSFQENWKNQVVSTFIRGREQLEEFSTRTQKFDEIDQWFTLMWRRLVGYPQDTEKIFFKNIYPSIKTLRSKLSDIEFEEFKVIFFRDFLNVLEIEEFGQKGEQFNPEKHQPYVKDRERSGGMSQIIQKVDMPGYKAKYTSEILEKALVEL